MNHLKTSINEDSGDTKPLFASTWMALFTGLRKNYFERNFTAPVNPENLNAASQNQAKQKSNSN